MADGFAPTVDKVGPPASGAPDSDAQAASVSGLPGTAPTSNPISAPTGPVIPGLTATAPPVEEKKLEARSGGAGPALSAPKPVEVMSVPDTPINGSTPAGGTPRPELNIPTETVDIPSSNADGEQKSMPSVTTGVQEPTPTPAVSMPIEDSLSDPIKDAPGAGLNGKSAGEPAEMVGAIKSSEDSGPSEVPTAKRKLEDDAPTASVNGGAVSQPEPDRAEKKIKLNETAAAPANIKGDKPVDNSSATTEAKNGTEKTNGRAKPGMGKRAKKIAEAVVGKTARKTRSQGPAAH